MDPIYNYRFVVRGGGLDFICQYYRITVPPFGACEEFSVKVFCGSRGWMRHPHIIHLLDKFNR